MGTALAYALWFRGIYRLKTSAVVAQGLISPVIATLVGYLFLRQALTLVQLLGFVIVMGNISIQIRTKMAESGVTAPDVRNSVRP